MRRTGALAREHQTPRWRLVVSRVASSRPVAIPIALIAIGLLTFAATHVGSTKLGLSLVRALPAGSEVRRADEAASRGFAPGIVSPTEVDLLAPGIAARPAQLARLEDLVARQPGVAAVVGPREQPPPPAPQVQLRARRRRRAPRGRLRHATRSERRRSTICGRCATACPACCAAPG